MEDYTKTKLFKKVDGSLLAISVPDGLKANDVHIHIRGAYQRYSNRNNYLKG